MDVQVDKRIDRSMEGYMIWLESCIGWTNTDVCSKQEMDIPMGAEKENTDVGCLGFLQQQKEAQEEEWQQKTELGFSTNLYFVTSSPALFNCRAYFSCASIKRDVWVVTIILSDLNHCHFKIWNCKLLFFSIWISLKTSLWVLGFKNTIIVCVFSCLLLLLVTNQKGVRERHTWLGVIVMWQKKGTHDWARLWCDRKKAHMTGRDVMWQKKGTHDWVRLRWKGKRHTWLGVIVIWQKKGTHDWVRLCDMTEKRHTWLGEIVWYDRKKAHMTGWNWDGRGKGTHDWEWLWYDRKKAHMTGWDCVIWQKKGTHDWVRLCDMTEKRHTWLGEIEMEGKNSHMTRWDCGGREKETDTRVEGGENTTTHKQTSWGEQWHEGHAQTVGLSFLSVTASYPSYLLINVTSSASLANWLSETPTPWHRVMLTAICYMVSSSCERVKGTEWPPPSTTPPPTHTDPTSLPTNSDNCASHRQAMFNLEVTSFWP